MRSKVYVDGPAAFKIGKRKNSKNEWDLSFFVRVFFDVKNVPGRNDASARRTDELLRLLLSEHFYCWLSREVVRANTNGDIQERVRTLSLSVKRDHEREYLSSRVEKTSDSRAFARRSVLLFFKRFRKWIIFGGCVSSHNFFLVFWVVVFLSLSLSLSSCIRARV